MRHNLSTNLAEMINAAEHMAMSMRLATRAVISDIETNAIAITIDDQRWYDVRPMLDEREQPSECIDMAREAIAYAIETQIVEQHPELQHFLRIVQQKAPL